VPHSSHSILEGVSEQMAPFLQVGHTHDAESERHCTEYGLGEHGEQTIEQGTREALPEFVDRNASTPQPP